MAEPSNTRRLASELAVRRSLLLLDYDGTLREGTADPAQAGLNRKRRDLLRRLADWPLRLALISGRSVEDLQRQAGVEELIYCGDFGLEIVEGKWRFIHPRAAAFREHVSRARDRLRRELRGLPGVLLQPKAWGLSVHYRRLPAAFRSEFQRRVERARGATPGLRWVPGDLAWELTPDLPWDKGNAARLLWRRFGGPYLVAIGDGVSDEAMFEAVGDHGASIRVGGRAPTAAGYRLKDVASVYRFLERVAAAAERYRLRAYSPTSS